MIAASERSKVVNVDCVQCKTKYSLLVNPKDIISWQAGAYIQDCMSYLSAAERELLISKTCNGCWINLFGENNDEV